MNRSISRFPWLFLMLGFAISWAVWIPVAFTGKDYQSSAFLLTAVLVGAFGPGLAAIILTYSSRDLDKISDFRDQIFDYHRIRPGWLLIILATWPAFHGIAIGITTMLGEPIPRSAFLQELIQQPNTLPIVIFLYLIQAGIEEIGWRGYLQDKLGDIFGPGRGSILVGVIQTVWHLPLFLVAGTKQMKMGIGIDSFIFVAFVISSATENGTLPGFIVSPFYLLWSWFHFLNLYNIIIIYLPFLFCLSS